MFLFTLPILREIYRKYSWECIWNMLPFKFYLIFPYFSTWNRIGIILNWKLRQCVVADDKIFRAIWMNSCGGKNYLEVSCKMYKKSYWNGNRICLPCVTIIEFKVVISGILILFITFRNGSLFQNHVSNSSEISLTFSNDRVSKLCSWKHVYWRSFINALLLKFLYSRYCIIFTSCLLQKPFVSMKVILWKFDDPVSITVEFWNTLTYLQWLVQ